MNVLRDAPYKDRHENGYWKSKIFMWLKLQKVKNTQTDYQYHGK